MNYTYLKKPDMTNPAADQAAEIVITIIFAFWPETGLASNEWVV